MAETNQIKKRVKQGRDVQQRLSLHMEKLKCECTHTKHGEPTITPMHNRRNGELTYMCTACTKENINLKRHDEDVIDNAIKIVDSMCDVIKLSIDVGSEKDREIGEEIAKLQFSARNHLKKLYLGALRKGVNGGGQKRGRDDKNRNGGSSLSRARIAR